MKILQLIQRPQLRGAEVFATQLSNHLIELGHAVKLIALFTGEEILPFKGELIKLNRPKSVRTFDLVGLRRLAKIVRHFQPDIVQANAGDTLKYAVFSRLIFTWKAKIVFRNASTMSLYLQSWRAKMINRFLLRHIDLVASVSHASKGDIVKLYSFLENRTKVIPIGIEEDLLKAQSTVKEHTVIHIGGFSFEKNHRGVLRIMIPVLRQYPSLKLLLVGDGSLRSEVEALVKDIPERDRIHFLGFRRDAMEILSRSKLLILPSLIEGLPAVILEAMACKVPIVAYNVGGISELIIDGETGRLVEKGDEKAFESSVLDALGDDSSRMLDSAYENILHNFRNTIIAKRFVDVYAELINKTKL